MTGVRWMTVASLVGLVLSQLLSVLTPAAAEGLRHGAGLVSKVCLACIMIGVGLELPTQKKAAKGRLKPILIAILAAAVPWILASVYFIVRYVPRESWTDFSAVSKMLLLARFAAPTSAGVLLSALAAVRASRGWLYDKTRELSIYDDIDTILMATALQCAIAGLRWQLAVVVPLNLVLLAVWKVFARKLSWPSTLEWRIGYAVALVALTEALSGGLTAVDPSLPVHYEVLLPAFVLGVALRPPVEDEAQRLRSERRNGWLTLVFMLVVGLSLPSVVASIADQRMTLVELGLGVLVLTLLINAGKLVVVFFFRDEATRSERIALGAGMCVRGEVGIGVACLAGSYGAPPALVAMSLLVIILNLLMTGPILAFVNWLLSARGSIHHALRRTVPVLEKTIPVARHAAERKREKHGASSLDQTCSVALSARRKRELGETAGTPAVQGSTARRPPSYRSAAVLTGREPAARSSASMS
ncbi:MAG: hypothetical protein R3B70_27095 [Polyangiaceae bacterium]